MEIEDVQEREGEGEETGSTTAASPGDMGKSHCMDAGSTLPITSSILNPSLAGYLSLIHI